MKVSSQEQLPTYQVIGSTLRIHWDAVQVTKETDMGIETYWEQFEAVCNILDSRNTIIESIVASVYTTGAELAAINNGGEEYTNYQAFRQHAKDLADGWIAQR